MGKLHTAEKKAQFIEELKRTKNPSKAAKAINYSRTQVYAWRERDPDFKAAWDEAIMEIIDDLEGGAMERAINGFLEPVYQMGQKVGVRRVFHPNLTIFMLKCNRPEKYGDKVTMTIDAAEYAKQVRESLAAQDEAAQRALEGLAPVSNRALPQGG